MSLRRLFFVKFIDVERILCIVRVLIQLIFIYEKSFQEASGEEVSGKEVGEAWQEIMETPNPGVFKTLLQMDYMIDKMLRSCHELAIQLYV